MGVGRWSALTWHSVCTDDNELAMLAFRTLVLDEIIIHSIPRIRRADRGDGVGPDLSDIPVELPEDGRSYLTERLISALLKARPVREMPEHASPIPD